VGVGTPFNGYMERKKGGRREPQTRHVNCSSNKFFGGGLLEKKTTGGDKESTGLAKNLRGKNTGLGADKVSSEGKKKVAGETKTKQDGVTVHKSNGKGNKYSSPGRPKNTKTAGLSEVVYRPATGGE